MGHATRPFRPPPNRISFPDLGFVPFVPAQDIRGIGSQVLNGDTGNVFDLTAAFDDFLKDSTTTGRKATLQFFHDFVSTALSSLTTDILVLFLYFDFDDDEGPTFHSKISLEIKKAQWGLVDSIRQTIQRQTEEPVSGQLLEQCLEDSGIRLLLQSANPESLLAATLNVKHYIWRKRVHTEAKDDLILQRLEGFDLRLAKYEARRSGFTVRDNGPLISRLRDEIRAQIGAFETPGEVKDQGIGASGHFRPKTRHGDSKSHTSRHQSKHKKSSSARIWKHITISRDETSASNFIHERILILFLKRQFHSREYAEPEDNDLRQIGSFRLAQQEQHLRVFHTYPRPEAFAEEASSYQISHQNSEIQGSSNRLPLRNDQVRKMDSNCQESAKVAAEGFGNGSKATCPDNVQDHRPSSHVTYRGVIDATHENDREAGGNWKLIHILPNSGGHMSTAYLDKPVWAPGVGRDNFSLKAFLPVTNVEEYVHQSGFDFTIARFYSQPPLMPELRRALAKKQPPPDPIHYHEEIHLHSQQMREALQEFFTFQPDILKNCPNLDVRAPIHEPYIFWYTCRSTADLQQLSQPHQGLVRSLTAWIDRNYRETYAEANRNLQNGVITLKTMPFLLCPGDVLIWKEKGKTKAAITSSQVSRKSPPILYWDSSQLVEWANYNNGGAKKGEFSTTWGVDTWSYRFNGEFLRDKRFTEIKFKASSLEQEVDISKLGVYPLRFADIKTKLQLETRGKTFWTCRFRNLVSHTGEEGPFVVGSQPMGKTESQLTVRAKNGERFMVDFQVYKQLHSDSVKFKLMYGKDSDSDGDGESDVSDDDENADQSENRHRMTTEDMTSETPPSRPYIYVFPDTVPGYNLRSKKWGK